MEYAHIPVDWGAPQQRDFDAFAGVMQAPGEVKTLLHCQANYRASAFAMLYRVLYEGVPLPEAKRAMNAVWTPDKTWTVFIRSVLKTRGVDPDCKGCDWTPRSLTGG